MFDLIERVEKSAFASAAFRIRTGENADVELIDDQVAESWGTKAFGAPSVFARVTDYAIAGWEAESTGKIGGRCKLRA